MVQEVAAAGRKARNRAGGGEARDLDLDLTALLGGGSKEAGGRGAALLQDLQRLAKAVQPKGSDLEDFAIELKVGTSNKGGRAAAQHGLGGAGAGGGRVRRGGLSTSLACLVGDLPA
jgi:hypothetical protein